MQNGPAWLEYLLFLTVAFSPSIVRWSISAICVPRIVYRITGNRIALFFALNVVLQFAVAYLYPHIEIGAACAPGDWWCSIVKATIAVTILETILSMGWMVAAAVRRRRN